MPTSVVALFFCDADTKRNGYPADIRGRLRCVLPASPTSAGCSGLTKGTFFRNPSGGSAFPKLKMAHNRPRTDRPYEVVVVVLSAILLIFQQTQ